MRFIDREEELDILENEFERDSASFIVIYGRRRIGKTRLIEEFIKHKPGYIYYLASDEAEVLQIKELQQHVARFFRDDFLYNQDIHDWKLFFSYLKKIWPRNEKLIFIIDEFNYLVKNNKAFPSYLQNFWDTVLSKTKTKLIVSGSVVRLMVEKVLSHGSPLYGRRTSDILLEELKIMDVKKFLNVSFEDAIRFWSVLGGVPKYLELASPSFEDFLTKLFSKKSFFYREGYYLMTEELKDIANYLNILRGLAEGYNKINELANFTGIEQKKIYPYIDVLESLGFVRREEPVIGKRKTLFFINDNFLDFWFNFIHKYRSDIELDSLDVSKLKNEINAFIGKKFELLCKKNFGLILKGYSRVGKQWGKIKGKPKGENVYEIDIVALNDERKQILFGECKWQANVNAEKIVKSLVEKAGFVQWHNAERRESFAVFAKSFKKRLKSFEGRPVYCFDLKDLERIFKLGKRKV
ncbi:ATP-binding protein [Candidatus Woesearchaeota archaeon]|nr:ATP-binding protein [Candidatus Woesearchaeota archaeon]